MIDLIKRLENELEEDAMLPKTLQMSNRSFTIKHNRLEGLRKHLKNSLAKPNVKEILQNEQNSNETLR